MCCTSRRKLKCGQSSPQIAFYSGRGAARPSALGMMRSVSKNSGNKAAQDKAVNIIKPGVTLNDTETDKLHEYTNDVINIDELAELAVDVIMVKAQLSSFVLRNNGFAVNLKDLDYINVSEKLMLWKITVSGVTLQDPNNYSLMPETKYTVP